MKKVFLAAAALIVLTVMLFTAACTSSTTTSTVTSTVISPGNGSVINSDSVNTVKIISITAQTTGYPWLLQVLIESTAAVGTLPNPVASSVGSTVTAVSDQDMSKFNVNDIIKAKIKYTGDVNIPGGIRLYLYSAAPQ